MHNQPIIPPQLNKNQLKIIGVFTLWDFIATFVFVGLSILIAWSLPDLGWQLQSLVGIFITLSLCSLLVPIKTKRVYTYIYLWIKFCFSNKKYKDKGLKNTSLLIPYQKIIDNFVCIGKEYMGAIKLEGFNLMNLSIDEQNIKIEQLRQLFKLLETEISLLKLDESLHFTKNAEFFRSKTQSLKKNKVFNKRQIESRTIQLKNYLNNFAEKGVLSPDQLEKNYYLIIYASSLKDIKKWINLALEKAQNANLNVKQLNHYQLVNMLKQFLHPYVLDFDNENIDKYKNNLQELLKFNDIKFHPDYFVANHDFYYQIQVITNLPTFPMRCWALPLMDSDGAIMININPLKKSTLKHQLSKSILNLSANIITTSKKDLVGKKEQEQKLHIYQELVNQIGYGQETIKKMNILIMDYGQSKRELLNKHQYFKNVLSENDITIDRLIFEQFEGYSAMLPKKTSPFSQSFATEIPTLTLAESFPFLTNSIKDEKGCYLGENLIGEPIVLDQFKAVQDDKMRKNHNMMIIGQTGSGKTTLAKKMINFHIAIGRKVMIIDPEREYKQLCDYYQGNWIDIGNSINGKINPLQVFGTLQDDKEIINNQVIISNHIQFLENWFELLFPDLTSSELRYFSQTLIKLYSGLKYQNNNILQLSAQEYPTFDDFVAFLKNNYEEKPEYYKIKQLISSEFIELGKYSSLYNGHSTISIKDNLLNVFDINNLYEKGNSRIINAQLYLLTAFIANEIKDNGFNDKNEIVILIDEAHLLIDAQKPIALDFIFQMVKRIRKRFGGMILVTQNPDDFLGSEEIRKKTMAIVNNLQYSFIMNLSPKNLDDVHEMYKSIGGLSKPQRNFIAHGKAGDALLINGGFERNEIIVKISSAEKEAFSNNNKGQLW